MRSGLGRLLAGTLRRQLTVGTALVVTSMMSLFVWDLTRRQEAVAVKQQTEQAFSLVRSVGTASAVWVASRDVSGLQEIVEGFAHYPDLRYLMVLDLRGQVLAHTDLSRRGKYLTDLPTKAEPKILQRGPSAVDVAGPVVLAGRHIGWARIGLGREALAASLEKIVRDGIAYTVVAIALSALLAGVAGRAMTRRLRAIQDAADAVQHKGAASRAIVLGDDEAAQLARQFNSMLDTLAEREAALEEALRRLQLVTNRVPGVVVLQIRLGTDGRFRVPYASEALREVYRLDPAEVRDDASALFAVVHPRDARDLRAAVEASAKDLTALSAEYRLKLGDEPDVCLVVNAMPQRERDGSVLWNGFVTDVTERKRADESLRQTGEALRRSEVTYHALFEHMLNGLAYCRMIFEDGRPVDWLYLRVNRAFERQTGLVGAAGRLVSDLIPGIREASPELFEIYGRVALTGETEQLEAYVEGLKSWFAISVYSPAKEHFVAVFDVITERKEAERVLRESHDELERRVAERTESLAEANRELEAFSYSVSHELRTPLRAIDGHAALIARAHDGLLDEEGRRRFAQMRWNAQRMGQLIDDLLSFSRAGRTDLKFHPVEMTKCAKAAFARVVTDPSILSRVSFSLGVLPDATGDTELLSRVWENLLSNAVKFSAGRERPEVHVEGSVSGGEAVYRVRDNGVGFSMKFVEKLFGVFQRLHAIHEFEGTGVGLALVRRIVLRHGGRVWAEGRLDEGATFSFSLPASEKPS